MTSDLKAIPEFEGYFLSSDAKVIKKVERKAKKPMTGTVTVDIEVSYMKRKDTPHVEMRHNSGTKKVRKVSKLVDELFGISFDGVQVPECPNYLVSKTGEVYSKTTGKLLRPTVGANGYKIVNLIYGTGKKCVTYLHHIVAKAYLDECFPGAHINHKDGNKENNRLDNLEWCTNQENRDHAWDTGLMDTKLRKCKLSLDNQKWMTFKSLKEAKEYIEVKTGTLMKNVSPLSKTAGNNAEEGKTNRGVLNTLNPFRCKGYIVKYDD